MIARVSVETRLLTFGVLGRRRPSNQAAFLVETRQHGRRADGQRVADAAVSYGNLQNQFPAARDSRFDRIVETVAVGGIDSQVIDAALRWACEDRPLSCVAQLPWQVIHLR